MARNRVLSFMSQLSNRGDRESRSPTPASPTLPSAPSRIDTSRQDSYRNEPKSASAQQQYAGESSSPQGYGRGQRVSSRPQSMVQTYQPPLMEMSQETLPELQPIFTFLNSHQNKLYQEGYFLKLNDQDSHGRPNADRTWTECFAQLVGTVLSLWDAAELDSAGQDGEVLPKFINLTDASIKMIEALPTRSNDDQPLQNVLSISTAGKNRYLLHFNSHHSLIQWTAGIRLAMYEHNTLQESYTGALIAGKGRTLNNINIIMEKTRFKTEDWVRVRFGAGTPWRRCWCVISPPDPKEVQKLEKQLNKKKSAYDRSKTPVLKGDVKFYDTKKTKKQRPIASITDAYSAFAIYPQSKPLIDMSTLIKVEGTITIHSNPPASTEGFVFVMPEVHAAVSGFEMMLRWLFPVFDTFGLYGRPGRLIADTLDPRSLMFAMPKERRYGYLEILDVSGLILTDGSQGWREMEWRSRMKDLTSKRMTAIANGSRAGSRYSRRSIRNSFGGGGNRVFSDGASIRSQPSLTWGQATETPFAGPGRVDSAPPAASVFQPPKIPGTSHHRSVSESQGLDRYSAGPAGYDGGYDNSPAPPMHATGFARANEGSNLKYHNDLAGTPERVSSEDENARITPVRELQDLHETTRPEPVATPPKFTHAPGTLPAAKPYHSPELRRAKSRMSQTTLSQMAGAGGAAGAAAVAYGDQPRRSEDARGQNYGRPSEDRGVLSDANTRGMTANHNAPEGLVARTNRLSFEHPLPPTPPPASDDSTFRSPPSVTSHPSAPTPQSAAPNQNHRVADSVLPNSSSYSDFPAPPGLGQLAPAADRQQGHAYTSSADSTRNMTSRLSAQSISRKPLPGRNESFGADTASPQTANIIRSPYNPNEPNDFDQNQRYNQTDDQVIRPAPVDRQNSHHSSVYDDTPAYAPQRPSAESRPSFERPRAGVLRTVGSSADEATSFQSASNIPAVDFGPTINYGANGLPRDLSPAIRAPSPAMRQAPSPVQDASRTSHRNVVTPDLVRPDSSGNRSVVWQPGMAAAPAQSPGRRVTPEQFVQQRAAAATATPLYAHQRQQSSNTMRTSTPTPPPHSRTNSSDIPQRPSSRGPQLSMAPAGSGDMSTQLTAKEREYLSRATGAPLVSPGPGNRAPAPTGGLVGSIDQREREKSALKQGINSQAVQHALNQRQMQAQQAQMQGQYRGPQQGYEGYDAQHGQQSYAPSSGGYQQYSAQQQYPPQRQQQQWGELSPPAFQQNSQWRPTVQGMPSPDQLHHMQQPQYFPPQTQPPQGRGRGPQQSYRGPGGF